MHTRLLQTLIITVSACSFGCSDSVSGRNDSDETPASGGTASGGASDGVGGSSLETGGSAADGGSAPGDGGSLPTSGGTTGTGGTTAVGGTTGDGGSPATGGNPGTGGTPGACTIGPALTDGTEYCSNGLGNIGDGYSYEIWMDSGQGTGQNCGTMYGVGAAFRAEWDLGSGGDFLARAGLYFGSTETHDQVGNISADYAFTKPDDNGFSWVAIYGWTFEPLTEYYIVEDWSEGRPATNYEFQGTITVDGGTYDIYRNFRENAASPAGTTDFDQYWSIRQEPRDCGHVSISAHFDEWNSLGMDMGLLRESMIVVEALNGSGTVDFSSATVQAQ